MYYIPQVTRCGCGFTCLKMLLAIVRKDERYLYLREDESHGPYNYQELLNIAQRHKVTMVGVKYDEKDNLRNFKKFPIIATVIKENDQPHAVLITKKVGQRLRIQDPERGVYWQRMEKFFKRWDGTFIAINHIEDIPFTSRIIDVKDTKGEVFSYIFQILAASFIALATFFVKPGGKMLLPILFCVGSLVSEILLRILLLKRMQKCDRYLRRFYPYVERKSYFEYYRRSQEYKKNALTMGLNFVFYLLVVLLITTIAIINSLTFAILIGVAFFSAFIEVFFFTPFKKELNKELENQESDLRKVREVSEMELQVKSMEVKSYRYAYISFASKLVFGAFFLLASFFTCMVEKTFALPNMVFYTCVSFLVYQYTVPLLSYDNRVQDTMVAKARINNLIWQSDENNSKR